MCYLPQTQGLDEGLTLFAHSCLYLMSTMMSCFLCTGLSLLCPLALYPTSPPALHPQEVPPLWMRIWMAACPPQGCYTPVLPPASSRARRWVRSCGREGKERYWDGENLWEKLGPISKGVTCVSLEGMWPLSWL